MSISIKKTLQQDGSNDPDDVLAIKKALNGTGHYKTPDYGITPYPDRSLFDAIKKYQKDWDLKVDGVMYPDGETIQSLNENPGVRSPIYRCTACGAPHGGSKGNLCPDCDAKS
jgi:murein L,D-transpeptidase YcbB/YkuD